MGSVLGGSTTVLTGVVTRSLLMGEIQDPYGASFDDSLGDVCDSFIVFSTPMMRTPDECSVVLEMLRSKRPNPKPVSESSSGGGNVGMNTCVMEE